MKVGYARVSTQDQNLDLQVDALKAAGCEVIYQEKASGKNMDRPELKNLMAALQPGHSLVVWKLDRLGRSLKDLIDQVASLGKQQVAFISLKENIDTSTATGELIFHVFGALAQFERALTIERTQAGLKAARLRGKKGGRPPGISKAQWSKACSVKTLWDLKTKSMAEIAQDLDISESTAFRYLKRVREHLKQKEETKKSA